MSKSKSKSIFVCQNCGAQRSRWEGKCSDCGEWNTLVEEISRPEEKSRGWSVHSANSGTLKPVALNQQIEQQKFSRYETGFIELDRVLGGGLVLGSFVLLGGSPGVGKSTLLMQMAGGLGSKKHRVLYVSSEESVHQTGSRAHRLGIRDANVFIASESNLNSILEMARNSSPEVLIVDSIQTIYLPEITAAPGSVSQVRECAGQLLSLAKSSNMSVILIGHVTKDGSLAGPKVLEHMVDAVLSFEGDLSLQFRMLRALKNRFGATNELGVFKMSGIGLEQVTNPSELFLEERSQDPIGSVVFASMEGSRPLLCEVQALTTPSPMAMPRRTALGIEANRLHLLTAVLDRHLNADFSRNDVYVNVVGGLKLEDPSSDVAVCASLLSTSLRKEIPPKSVLFGEIGLTGEIRAVNFAEQRVREADKLGFTEFVVPFSNQKHLKEFKIPAGKKIHWMKNVKDLMRWMDHLFAEPSKTSRTVATPSKDDSYS